MLIGGYGGWLEQVSCLIIPCMCSALNSIAGWISSFIDSGLTPSCPTTPLPPPCPHMLFHFIPHPHPAGQHVDLIRWLLLPRGRLHDL